MSLLIITAVDQEAQAIGPIEDVRIIAGGIGRTNAACVTTEALIIARERGRPIDAVLSAGIGGALPGGELAVGDVIVASSCIYVEEGLITSDGFSDMEAIGFPLGDFAGNAVPVDASLLELLSASMRIGPIATVATCSGTHAAATIVAQRTGAVAEAMEGAAVVHAARRLRIPAIELRAISNHTGDRANQQWDISRGLNALGKAARDAVAVIRSFER